MSAGLDTAMLGRSMHDLARELFPLPRSLTGPGYRRTLDMLEEVCGPMKRHRFATGEEVFDWTVPPEWTLRDARIVGPGGETVVSLADSTLHVVGYSTPVDRRMPLEELQEHLHSLPGQPDAIPYRTSYYNETWGFCLTDRQRRSLTPGDYQVTIDADLAPGHVEIGEVTISGESRSEVLFSTYCCHPAMANNELSGPVVAAHLARTLSEQPARPRLSYRFLFLPETIGAIAYLSRFGDRMMRDVVAGYVVTCVGDPAPFTYKRSRRGDSLADRAALHVLDKLGVERRVVDFFPGGSDERQFCSPGFNLPVGSLMRSMYWTYPEYHTSLDDLDFITPEALGGSLGAYRRIVDTLEANETLAVTVAHCEPQLGKRGLYPTTGGRSSPSERLKDMMCLLNYCDGSVDLISVAERTGRPLWDLRELVDLLLEHGLLRHSGDAGSPLPAPSPAANLLPS